MGNGRGGTIVQSPAQPEILHEAFKLRIHEKPIGRGEYVALAAPDGDIGFVGVIVGRSGREPDPVDCGSKRIMTRAALHSERVVGNDGRGSIVEPPCRPHLPAGLYCA
ncbi:MAG: hypothetical protein ACYTFG_21895, partial [Planctomycetota bacterium]